jgi:hypothetical protein
MNAQVIAEKLDTSNQTELIYKICRRLASNATSGVTMIPGDTPDQTQFHS